ncbi:MAG: DedA family protein [Pirellulaceae bacterium]
MGRVFRQPGDNSFIAVVAAGCVGSFAGAFFWYVIARWIGKRRISQWVGKHGAWLTISPSDIDRTEAWFDRWGGSAVLICRLIPGLRTLISIPAGFAEMGVAKFSIYTAIGTIAWTALLATLGWWLGGNYQDLVGPLGWVSTAVVAGLFLWWVYRVVRQSMMKQST